MTNQLSRFLQILIWTTFCILGCKRRADPGTLGDKCKLISYSANGIPVYLKYDNRNALISENYFTPSNVEVEYIHDSQGRLIQIVNVGKHFLGDTLLADFTYIGDHLETLRYYGREYYLSGKSEKSILACKLFYSKSDMPDLMQLTNTKIDSAGKEYLSEPIRRDKFFFDESGNLFKQETYKMDKEGRSSLVASNHHTYDSKPNYLRTFKQTHFLIDQSIACIFSKNNLLATRREVPGKPHIDVPYKIIYDGDLVVDDGMGFSQMKWLCK